MIIYNANHKMLKERIKEAEDILKDISAKTVFITGSFLFKKKYKDIDLFIITRSKKEFRSKNKKVNITKIPFNNLHSLFCHSVSKSCISKNILPEKPLRVTMSDYWDIINEAVPTIYNEKRNFRKIIRYLVLYTEYFLKGEVLDTFSLTEAVNNFRDYKDVLEYIKREVPKAIAKHKNRAYLKRYFYTMAGFYKDLLNYESHKYLYDLTHEIIKEAAYG
jgi:hypothetical protein